MSTCCNFNCNNTIMAKKRVRCGKCRFSNIMNCANCGDEVGNIQKIFCIDCAKESRLTWHRNYQREYKRINKEKYRVLQ